mmetsp:Transcript_96967/g.296382  ORF Transcript_96967/g.296382 Transcript_96967/m.296382 type:complete len:87 (-) Transcript_96967:182-442(-)
MPVRKLSMDGLALAAQPMVWATLCAGFTLFFAAALPRWEADPCAAPSGGGENTELMGETMLVVAMFIAGAAGGKLSRYTRAPSTSS